MLNVGVGLALLCAAVTQLGFLFKHKGANAAPRVQLQHPLSSARSLLACRWFRLGLAVAAAAWVLHVAALALAPLSVVQAVLSTGVVILAVLGDRLFGCHVSPRQWAGAGMTALGLLLLVVTLPRQGAEVDHRLRQRHARVVDVERTNQFWKAREREAELIETELLSIEAEISREIRQQRA